MYCDICKLSMGGRKGIQLESLRHSRKLPPHRRAYLSHICATLKGVILPSFCVNLNPGGNVCLKCCVFFWLTVISEQEFYGSRTSSAQELYARRISEDGDNVAVVETYHSSTYSAQNSTPGADHNAHAKLTYVSSLSAPDVHQVTDLFHVLFLPLCESTFSVLVLLWMVG